MKDTSLDCGDPRPLPVVNLCSCLLVYYRGCGDFIFARQVKKGIPIVTWSNRDMDN